MKDKLFDLIIQNLKNPKLYALILTIFIVLCWLFPFLDANIFYYKRINDRVDILAKASNLDQESISNNPTLQKEYENILFEISNQPESTLTNILVKETNYTFIALKFISGGVLVWIIAIMCFFIKGFNSIGYRIFGFFLFAFAGVLVGFVSKAIPNIINPWINIIGFPLFELTIAALLITSNKTNPKNQKKADN